MKRLNVYIVNSSWDYEKMWTSRGHNVVSSLELADLVQFTGGSDVSPELYGEKNVRSYCDANRDKYEQKIFNHCREVGKAMVGICRGGQFLNVMNGGKMWQHVSNHAIGGTHVVYDHESELTYLCTSTHHQMMIPGLLAEVVGQGIALCRSYQSEGGVYTPDDLGNDELDVEVVWYEDTHSLCFQPHPELDDGECQEYFFILIERYYGEL